MTRAKVWESIGGRLESSPLNPRMVGTVERATYRIEKVIFESQPQVYVTANLYIPKGGKNPFPAVVASMGHAPLGKAHRNYQYVFQTLARNGFVVLAFDPFGQGERQQYLDPNTGLSRLGPTGEHFQAGHPLLLLGATLAQYRAWDAVRAIDYLLTRPEVDPERVGFTGQSGGGTMTIYMCGLEPRIRVAVETEGNSENLAGPHYEPPGAIADPEQNLVGSLAAGLDRGDLLMAFAPKPLLLTYTPHDVGTTYSPTYQEATEQIYSELRRAYRILGAEERVQLFSSPLPHDFDALTRQAAYNWFNRWLRNDAAEVHEVDFDDSTPGTLNCTSTGQVLTSLGGRSVWQVSTDRARALIPPSPYRDGPPDLGSVRDEIRAKLRKLLALPEERGELKPATLASFVRKNVYMEDFEFRSEFALRIPGWFIRPNQSGQRFPTVICLLEGGKDEVAFELAKTEALVQKGHAVCSIDTRGLGVTFPRRPSTGPLFYDGMPLQDRYAWASLALDKPVAGQRVWDVLRCVDYLTTRPDVEASHIHIVGESSEGLSALMAAALDDRLRSVLLRRTNVDLRSIVESEDYQLRMPWFIYGILKEFDLPDLVASLAPRRCWLLNCLGPKGDVLAESKLLSKFDSAMRVFAQNPAQVGIRFLVQPDEEWGRIAAEWLEG
jgi:cephalosporin-C deacetylase-like acetyl esterase